MALGAELARADGWAPASVFACMIMIHDMRC